MIENISNLESLRAVDLFYGRTFQDCHAIKKPLEFSLTDLYSFLLSAGPPETAGFYALVNKAESIAFPDQPFESV